MSILQYIWSPNQLKYDGELPLKVTPLASAHLKTDFSDFMVRVTPWNSICVDNLVYGQLVEVEGELRTRAHRDWWTDRKYSSQRLRCGRRLIHFLCPDSRQFSDAQTGKVINDLFGKLPYRTNVVAQGYLLQEEELLLDLHAIRTDRRVLYDVQTGYKLFRRVSEGDSIWRHTIKPENRRKSV